MMRGWENGPHQFEAHHWWPELVGVILMALIAIAVIVGVVMVIRSLRRQQPGSSPGAGPPAAAAGPNLSAIHILEDRYARGDIDRDEFLRRRQDLFDLSGPPDSNRPTRASTTT